MDIKVSEEVASLLKDNGLKKDEMVSIIEDAESSGDKLKSKDGSKCLAKNESDNLTIYALYSSANGGFALDSAYAHKMKMIGLTGGSFDPDEAEETDWICNKCGETAVETNVDMSYLDVTRPGPAVVCPKCNQMYLEEDMMKTIKTAESILEEKRG
ncbi:hypothetical protein Mzhil_0355 [Methanosalsum zhilinae DSM 4017]|uniref:DUF7479 domain-containing protein n=1 Tax=Methanosalsum zhilinae (strain DSM 4017 / NBRC 107636 / OCM 62 / WeN5) TaxID=679901 RepID=F7XPA4_METZD|nr:hypothetical protein [Methanosalsum zhilinae]AEH60231.1 hypothetical protein Mzhil_0355 [Methanosalsum zhilinae DSM 4017]